MTPSLQVILVVTEILRVDVVNRGGGATVAVYAHAHPSNRSFETKHQMSPQVNRPRSQNAVEADVDDVSSVFFGELNGLVRQ